MILVILLVLILYISSSLALVPNNIKNMFNNMNDKKDIIPILDSQNHQIPQWKDLISKVMTTDVGLKLKNEENLRLIGEGLPHTDAKIRLFGSKGEPRVVFYRDTAAWCPYCQKVWILLEEKQIPYKIEKINMRSYGDKPASYLKLVPNGLLPAISIDGRFQTESLDIMLNLDRTFTEPNHKSMWPDSNNPEFERAKSLMRLERDLFSRWCNLVFRPSIGGSSKKFFEEGFDEVNKQLGVTDGPWFLNSLSIVDLTYITHIERMFASVAYWSGIKLRGDSRWPNIERWIRAFEQLPSYMATKSDYYTHVMDIPPQYGSGYSLPESEIIASKIDGTDGTWSLPLPPFNPSIDIEPVHPNNDPGFEESKHEAAYKIINNYENIIKFSLRGAGKPGTKQFQAPLADPYAIPAIEYYDDYNILLRILVQCLLGDYNQVQSLPIINRNVSTKNKLISSLEYLRDRIGVPRDMSYPAARQLRAHINYIKTLLNSA